MSMLIAHEQTVFQAGLRAATSKSPHLNQDIPAVVTFVGVLRECFPLQSAPWQPEDIYLGY